MRTGARLFFACSIAVLAAARGAGGQATVEGVVAIPSQPAPPVPGWRYPSRVVGEIGEPEPLAAVVYLEGSFVAAPPAAKAVAEMSQLHYQFVPGLLAIHAGSTVRFPNRDDEYHSVFSYSKAKRFDLGRYHRDESAAEILFDEPGIVRLYCEIHDHMRGTILVLETPYFARTDAAGRYRLEGLPAGPHVLKAWRPPDEVIERPIELSDGATVRVDFPAE
ncbi:MAG: carboxypeptidase regulatory-like domain-containing protein [Candidatus Binatia bacterium]